ncbi:phage holin family protein [Polynucleobacter sp. AP-Ainpum-60-G11]|uniref:phage holin family protein n=1 Tax=Polynucleobacter sp. AP-Ainpum-60-G11 TaxID=2576926 RepID=UPI001BFE48B4|nr:phage holin family protein [Polynucleobacter sp. AP-Ainpum-60-G11]QWE27549.1 phage holin family protein [Polynucleobacter sp. AP-Ainpum-60-G11]
MSQENLLSSLKNLVSTGASIAQTRLELISTDVQIARTKFLGLLVMAIFTLFFLFFGLIMLALLIVIYSWETDRILALSLLTAGFLAVGCILALVVLRSLKTMPKLFEATIAELAKDRQELAKR